MKTRWFLWARAGGDACVPSTMVFDYFYGFGPGRGTSQEITRTNTNKGLLMREFKGCSYRFAVSLRASVLNAEFDWTFVKAVRKAND